MKIKIALILLALLCAVACKKDVTDVNKNFVGFWTSNGINNEFTQCIYIDNNRNGVYSESSSGGSGASFKGTARANSKKLKIGDIFHFNILQPPTPIDTNLTIVYIFNPYTGPPARKAKWAMMLSEAYPAFYLKGNVTYYKADY